MVDEEHARAGEEPQADQPNPPDPTDETLAEAGPVAEEPAAEVDDVAALTAADERAQGLADWLARVRRYAPGLLLGGTTMHASLPSAVPSSPSPTGTAPAATAMAGPVAPPANEPPSQSGSANVLAADSNDDARAPRNVAPHNRLPHNIESREVDDGAREQAGSPAEAERDIAAVDVRGDGQDPEAAAQQHQRAGEAGGGPGNEPAPLPYATRPAIDDLPVLHEQPPAEFAAPADHPTDEPLLDVGDDWHALPASRPREVADPRLPTPALPRKTRDVPLAPSGDDTVAPAGRVEVLEKADKESRPVEPMALPAEPMALSAEPMALPTDATPVPGLADAWPPSRGSMSPWPSLPEPMGFDNEPEAIAAIRGAEHWARLVREQESA